MAETIHVKGEGGAIFAMDLPLHETVAARLAAGKMQRVNADGTAYREDPEQPPAADQGEQGGQQEPEQPPAQAAQKADWVGYAVRTGGMSVDDAEAMTKADLVERFGGRVGG